MTTDKKTKQELNHVQVLSHELDLDAKKVTAAVTLLADGNTIPFIARYRKEATQGLNEVDLRRIEDALERQMTLASRKTTVLKTIDEQGKLNDGLRESIERCSDLQSLEVLYLPYKPKRRSRATIAREAGLQTLADLLLEQKNIDKARAKILSPYVNLESGITDASAALAGAMDIVAETWSEDAGVRQSLLASAMSQGNIVSSVKRGKKEQGRKFEMYFDYREAIRKIPSHRVLALLRGANEGVLRVSIELNDEQVIDTLKRKFLVNPEFEFRSELLITLEDCYKRLLLPSTETTVLHRLKETADEEAIDVFGRNLSELLLAAPAGPKATIGIDPGFRTGCKVAVVDRTGKFLTSTAIYPTEPKNDMRGAEKTLLGLISAHDVELIAIGNGTASRETDIFVTEMIRNHNLKVTKVVVSESGASIYSASDIAIKEFPDLDITVRGAISIARRLQDPLAELVKTDPKSIGVGQYQHDVNQTLLRKCLDRVVESCVNSVGVDLNTASGPLLSHVAGIGPKLADNIVQYRNESGSFSDRRQLIKVPKLGKKAYEQAAGFLRVRQGKQPLDNSGVHPESYHVVDHMAKSLGVKTNDLVGDTQLSAKLRPKDFVDDFAQEAIGLPTLTDIVNELAKPGRDPREQFRAVKFNDAVNTLEDLKSDMVLEGVITNVTNFGAFVDIGVHQDALIHISQLADSFVKDPNDVVSVGDIVKVKVLEVDVERKRISVTRKFKSRSG